MGRDYRRGVNPQNHFSRYWNDCASIYQALIECGFEKSKILVLMSDGNDTGADLNLASFGTPILVDSPKDLDGDGVGDITTSATLQHVDSSVAASCSCSQYAYASEEHNYFMIGWVNAMRGVGEGGESINADENNDGYVSFTEAFNSSSQYLIRMGIPNQVPPQRLALGGIIDPALERPVLLASEDGTFRP